MSEEFEKVILEKLNGIEEKLDNQEQFNAEQKQFNAEQKQFNKKCIERIQTIERALTIIEDEVKNKIPALFDADTTRMQREEKLEEELNHLRRCIRKSFY